MSDDVKMLTPWDRLPPAEKAGDYKGGQNPHERLRKKKMRETLTTEEGQEKGAPLEDPSAGDHPGKIVDIVI